MWSRRLQMGSSDLVVTVDARVTGFHAALVDVTGKRSPGSDSVDSSIAAGPELGARRRVRPGRPRRRAPLPPVGSGSDVARRPRSAAGHAPPAAAVLQVATAAAEVKTTLGVDDDEELGALVACGQATACNALMAVSRRKTLSGTRELEVHARLAGLWGLLQGDPHVRGRP